LVSEFEQLFGFFNTFVEGENLGEVVLNQWELTYIDAFPREEYWKTPADWSDFLPGLFGKLFPTEGMNIHLEHRTAEWSYEILSKQGRLHIAAQPGRAKDDNRDSLLLQMTARGPIAEGTAKKLRAGLDLGHETAVEAFLRITSPEAKNHWGPKP